jgi:hypothetical protein
MLHTIPISSGDFSFHCKEITSAIKTACEYIEEEFPSLDQKISSTKAKNISEIKEQKTFLKDKFKRLVFYQSFLLLIISIISYATSAVFLFSVFTLIES